MNKSSMLMATVYPSIDRTIGVADTVDEYGGAHRYVIFNCVGFNAGKTEYVPTTQEIQFIHKLPDGNVIPGLQSEQLVLMLIDRHEKLNAKYPSEQNARMIEGLKMFISACKDRVDERIKRGVMGELKR